MTLFVWEIENLSLTLKQERNSMIPQIIWEVCRLIGGATVGRSAIQAIVRVLPTMSRQVVASYLKQVPQQAVLVIRQMARVFRMNSSRSVESVAAEVVRSFKGITSAVGEGPAIQFFTDLWNILSKDVKLLEIILRG